MMPLASSGADSFPGSRGIDHPLLRAPSAAATAADEAAISLCSECYCTAETPRPGYAYPRLSALPFFGSAGPAPRSFVHCVSAGAFWLAYRIVKGA
jgi:hypothetical protein